MMRLNGCRRCKGALVIEKDVYGWYEECIQCGYMHNINMEKTPVPEDLPYCEEDDPAVKGETL